MVKPQKNTILKDPAWRNFLMILVVFLTIIGILLLVRAYFKDNPPAGNDDIGFISSLPDNPPLQIGTSFSELGQQNSNLAIWGEDINSHFNLPTGKFLQANGVSNTYLLNLDLETPLIASLPSGSRNIHLFDDQSILYTLPSTNLTGSQIRGFSPTNGDELLLELELGKEIDSLFFGAKEKVIVMSTHTAQNSQIKLLRASGEVLDVIVLSESQVFILNVDEASDVLWYRSETDCKKLDLINKVQLDVKCEFVRQTPSGLNITTNPDYPGEDQLDFIKLTKSGNGNQQVLVEAELEVEQFKLAITFKEIMAYVRETTVDTVDEESNPVAEIQYSIHVLDLVTGSEIRSIELLPTSEILDLSIDSEGKVLLLDATGVWLELELDPEIVEPTATDQWQLLEFTECELGCDFSFIN